jgi:hypothetical protein
LRYADNRMRNRLDFHKTVYVLANWALFGMVAIGLYQVLARIKWPEPILVYRDGKVSEYSWRGFIMIVMLIAGSLWLALTTKVGERAGPTDIGHMFRWQARTTGWLIAIGGTLGAIHLLLILLGNVKP